MTSSILNQPCNKTEYFKGIQSVMSCFYHLYYLFSFFTTAYQSRLTDKTHQGLANRENVYENDKFQGCIKADQLLNFDYFLKMLNCGVLKVNQWQGVRFFWFQSSVAVVFCTSQTFKHLVISECARVWQAQLTRCVDPCQFHWRCFSREEKKSSLWVCFLSFQLEITKMSVKVLTKPRKTATEWT